MEKMRAFKSSPNGSTMSSAIRSIAEEGGAGNIRRPNRGFSTDDGYSSPEGSDFEDPLTDIESYVAKYANEVAMTSGHETATDAGTETDGFSTDYGY